MGKETMRTHVIMPRELVETIDKLVGRRARSRFLTEAAEREVRRLKLIKVPKRQSAHWPMSTYPVGRPLNPPLSGFEPRAEQIRSTLPAGSRTDEPLPARHRRAHQPFQGRSCRPRVHAHG